jgi:predicted small metal-binding protein
MSKVIHCNDIFPGCAGVVMAESDDEVLRLAAEHAQNAHDVEEIDDATVEKVRAAIRTE